MSSPQKLRFNKVSNLLYEANFNGNTIYMVIWWSKRVLFMKNSPLFKDNDILLNIKPDEVPSKLRINLPNNFKTDKFPPYFDIPVNLIFPKPTYLKLAPLNTPKLNTRTLNTHTFTKPIPWQMTTPHPPTNKPSSEPFTPRRRGMLQPLDHPSQTKRSPNSRNGAS